MRRSRVFEVVLPTSHTVVVPGDVTEPFVKTGKRRVEVRSWFDGQEVRFHAALQKRKDGYHLMFSRQKQKALGVFPGDFFQMQLYEDQTEFGAEIPDELQETFSQWPEAHTAFMELTDGAKRSVIYGIARYRTPQKRIDKSLEVCERLCQGLRKTRDLFD